MPANGIKIRFFFLLNCGIKRKNDNAYEWKFGFET